MRRSPSSGWVWESDSEPSLLLADAEEKTAERGEWRAAGPEEEMVEVVLVVEQQEAVLLALVPLGSVLTSVLSGVEWGALGGLFLSLDDNESWLPVVFE